MRTWNRLQDKRITALKRKLRAAKAETATHRKLQQRTAVANRSLAALNQGLQSMYQQVERERDVAKAQADAFRRVLDKLDREHADLSGRLQDAEHQAGLYQQHMNQCEVADTIDHEDRMKRAADQ